MTPLIDRYLHNVGLSLPAARRDDIVRELAEDIRTQVADREEELGRSLTDAEQDAVLKQFGHPLMLATRYGPQRHVIGPALFPVYWMALKIALGGALAVNVALAMAFLVGGSPPARAIGQLASFPFTVGVMVFGWVTLVFALLDLNLPRLMEHAWADMKGLVLPAPEGKGRRWTLIAEIVGSTVFLLWWLTIAQTPFVVFGPAASFLALAPIWQQIYLPITVIWLVSLVSLWAVLIRPDWARVRTIGRFLTDGLSLVLAVVLLNADAVVQFAPGVEQTEKLVAIVRFINAQARIVLLIWLLASMWQILYSTYRLVTATSTKPR
ncbi:MAG: hypothetical protein ABIT71_17175 [Vicinamibacteraceae bacterium]